MNAAQRRKQRRQAKRQEFLAKNRAKLNLTVKPQYVLVSDDKQAAYSLADKLA